MRKILLRVIALGTDRTGRQYDERELRLGLRFGF
jgi:hypothetical protein